MKKNEGTLDRIIRAVLGIALVVTGLTLKALAIGGIAGLVIPVVLGGVLLFTAATGVCLLYIPFGISTCKK